MKPVTTHCIPDEFFDIEANDNEEKFIEFRDSVQEARTNVLQYLCAFEGMIYMNETVDE